MSPRRDRCEYASAARRLRSRAMRGLDLAVFPGVRQTFHEAIEIRMAVREHVDAVARGQAREMMLDGSNFIEETQGVEVPRTARSRSFIDSAMDVEASNRAQGVSGAWYRLRTWAPTRSLSASLNDGWKKFTKKREAE
jgi:hypothetical protein